MNVASYIVSALVVLWAVFAVIHETKRKDCCGDCKSCGSCKKKRRNDV